MIKKSIFIVLAVFGLSSVAEMMHTEVDHMSDMVSEMEGEGSSFGGSVWLKYKALGFPKEETLSYRARLGWSGSVNEAIQWGVGLSSNLEQYFKTPSLVGINLEQAYVSYSVEGFSITAGKHEWKTNFHKKGILYDERLYPEGVAVKYHHTAENEARFYGKVALYELDDNFNGPLTEGATIKGKIGGSFPLFEEVKGGIYASAVYDGLFKDEKVEPQTLAQLGVHFSASNMVVPVGVFGIYVTSVKKMGKSFTGGVYVGNTGAAPDGESGDFGLAVSYYDIDESDFDTELLNRDYVSGAGKGIAARAQYNLLDNTNFVAKYAYDLDGGEDASSLVGELTCYF